LRNRFRKKKLKNLKISETYLQLKTKKVVYLVREKVKIEPSVFSSFFIENERIF